MAEGINVGIAQFGVALQKDELTPCKNPSFVHGLTGGTPFHFERTIDTISVACGTRANSGAYANEINTDPSIETLAYHEVAPLYAYGALGQIETTQVKAGLYKHKITLGTLLPSLTIFGQEGIDNFNTVQGCKVDELEISFEGSEPLNFGVNLQGCHQEFLDDTPFLGLTPACYTGYYRPTGGVFRIDTAGDRPEDAIISSGNLTISNDCEKQRSAESIEPKRISMGKNTASVSMEVLVDDITPYRKMVTGKKDGIVAKQDIVYGSYYWEFTHSEHEDWKLIVEGYRVPFAGEMPDVDPEGNSGSIEFTSEDSYVDKVGDSPVTITFYNDVPDYFNADPSKLPKVQPDAFTRGYIDGLDVSDLGNFYVSKRSQVISGTAKRINEEGKEGYFLALELENSEGATATPHVAARDAEVPVPFVNGAALIPLGYDGIEVTSITVTDGAGNSSDYQLAIECAEEAPMAEVTVATGERFGKDVATLGEYKISNRAQTIKGTANCVTDYTGFGTFEKQQGMYLPLNIEPWDGTKVRLHKTDQDWEQWKDLKEDGIVVFRLGDENIEFDELEVGLSTGRNVTYSLNITCAQDLPPVVMKPADDQEYLGKRPSELGTIRVSNRGRAVTGTAKKITWEQFAQDTEKQEGYYTALNVEPWKCAQVRVKSKGVWGDYKDLVDNGDVYAFLGKEEIEAEAITYKGEDGTETEYKLNITAEPAPVMYNSRTRAVKKSSKKAA